jgi:hypothetical protein
VHLRPVGYILVPDLQMEHRKRASRPDRLHR